MGKTATAVLALLAGIVVGAFGALGLGGGAMVGAGAGTGLATGICMTAWVARELGYLNAAQADEVIRRAGTGAASDLASVADTQTADMVAACDKVLAKAGLSSAG